MQACGWVCVCEGRRRKRRGRREWKGEERRWSLEHVTGMTSRFVFVSVSDIPPFYLIVQGQVCSLCTISDSWYSSQLGHSVLNTMPEFRTDTIVGYRVISKKHACTAPQTDSRRVIVRLFRHGDATITEAQPPVTWARVPCTWVKLWANNCFSICFITYPACKNLKLLKFR